MPPQRPRLNRDGLARDQPYATANGPLLARYHSGMGGPVGFRIPLQQQQPSIIIPIMCPVPVPIQQWDQAQNVLRSAAMRNNAAASSWPLLPNAGSGNTGYELSARTLNQQSIPAQQVVPDVAVSNIARPNEVTGNRVRESEQLGGTRGGGRESEHRRHQFGMPVEEEEEPEEEDAGQQQGQKTKYNEAWDSMFERLVRYKMSHGDCLVPTHYKLDSKLGRWVMNQRHKKDQLSPVRKQRLSALGFVWCVKQQETWDSMYERLVRYKLQHGDCLVPQKYKEDSRLGEWVQTQRRDKKRRKNLSPERQARLEAIGFEWCPHNYIWDNMFKRLLKFKAKYGNCLVPRHWDDDPKLGRWVDQQRVKNKKGNLGPDRRAQLHAVGFIWKMR